MTACPAVVVRSAVSWLPPTVERAEQAVAEARTTPEDATAVGYEELPVATDLSAPEMAVRAGRAALERAGRSAASLDLLVHAWTYYQGHDFWSPAHYVASELGATGAVPLGVQQMCNGGAAAVEVAVDRLANSPAGATVLVTTADRFGAPGFDRWRGDYGLWYGDGATATVLTAGPAGPHDLEIAAVATAAAPALEEMHRGALPFAPAPRSADRPVDVRAAKKAYLSRRGKDGFVADVRLRVRDVLTRALDDAGVDPAELGSVLLPRIGVGGLESVYRPAVAEVTPAPALDLGARTGHLGAGDLVANLAALVDAESLRPGGAAAVLSAGAGFTWSCVVVRRPHRDHHRTKGPDHV